MVDSVRTDAARIAAYVVANGFCKAEYDEEVEEILAGFNIQYNHSTRRWEEIPVMASYKINPL